MVKCYLVSFFDSKNAGGMSAHLEAEGEAGVALERRELEEPKWVNILC